MSALVQKFVTEDGKQFDTKAEAIDYLRKPLITAALNKVDGDNKELTDWLVENQDAVEGAFESTTIQRVTKAERAQLAKALEAVVVAGDKAFAFITTNKEHILDSFRWPSVKRGTKEEQAATVRGSLMQITGDNNELSDWLIANQTAVLDAFQAGIVKREVNPKAVDALAAYRAKQAARKAEKDVAVAEDKAAVEAGKPATAVAALEAKFKAEDRQTALDAAAIADAAAVEAGKSATAVSSLKKRFEEEDKLAKK